MASIESSIDVEMYSLYSSNASSWSKWKKTRINWPCTTNLQKTQLKLLHDLWRAAAQVNSVEFNEDLVSNYWTLIYFDTFTAS